MPLVRKMRHFGWPGLAAVLWGMCTCAAAEQTSVKVDESSLAKLPGQVSRVARPEFDGGRAPDSLPREHILMMLRRSQEKEQELRQFIGRQYDPHSPDFHH